VCFPPCVLWGVLSWPRILRGLGRAAQAIDAFNAANKWKKRGICMVPMRYSIQPGMTAGPPVTLGVSSDGSVDVHHTGIELGQGLSTKVAQMIAVTLGIPIAQVSLHAVTTDVTPNPRVTGGSSTSETQAEAARLACEEIKSRLAGLKRRLTDAECEAHPMGAWPAKPAGEAPSWGMICALANTSGTEGLPDSYGAAGFVPSVLCI
jgi:CO/xanthine dehydrogenase Mo-binding subunit